MNENMQVPPLSKSPGRLSVIANRYKLKAGPQTAVPNNLMRSHGILANGCVRKEAGSNHDENGT